MRPCVVTVVSMSAQREYWNEIGARLRGGRAPLWRQYSDAVNARLLARWMPAQPVKRIVKTDLFDEAYSDGLLPQLRRHAEVIFGIDVAGSTASVAASRHEHLRVSVSDVRKLPFRDSSIDVAVSNSTLDHFADIASVHVALGELHRVLRSGGRLLVTLDNPWHPILALRHRLPTAWLLRAGLVPYESGQTLGARELRAALETQGFDVTDSAAVMHFPRVFVAQLARLFPRGRGAGVQRRLLAFLMAWERLGHLPSRYLTGHFVAALAVKRPASP